jgi:hypothetical protein
MMSLIKWLILGCLLIIGFSIFERYKNLEVRKAYDEGYNDGMIAVSPDYCLKVFANNDAPKFRYIKRQYCKGEQK